MQAGSLIAAAGPERLDSQASMTRNQAQYTRGKDRGEEPEEKPDQFVLLEWLIREKLMQQYQKMNFSAQLEEPDY